MWTSPRSSSSSKGCGRWSRRDPGGATCAGISGEWRARALHCLEHALALRGEPVAPSPELALPVGLLTDRGAVMHKSSLRLTRTVIVLLRPIAAMPKALIRSPSTSPNGTSANSIGSAITSLTCGQAWGVVDEDDVVDRPARPADQVHALRRESSSLRRWSKRLNGSNLVKTPKVAPCSRNVTFGRTLPACKVQRPPRGSSRVAFVIV